MKALGLTRFGLFLIGVGLLMLGLWWTGVLGSFVATIAVMPWKGENRGHR